MVSERGIAIVTGGMMANSIAQRRALMMGSFVPAMDAPSPLKRSREQSEGISTNQITQRLTQRLDNLHSQHHPGHE
jgi:hypothetical protein